MIPSEVNLLPILKIKNQQPGVIVQERQSNALKEKNDETTEHQEELESFVKDLLVAFSFKDIKKIAESIKIIHDVLHMHMDNEPSEDTNFALQNARAYKNEQE